MSDQYSTTVAAELINIAYSPRIAVISSSEVQVICQLNNLSFTEMITPFCSLTTSVSWQEPNGLQISPSSLKITVVDIGSRDRRRLELQRDKKILLSRVSQNPPPLAWDQLCGEKGNKEGLTRFCLGKPGVTQEYDVEVPAFTPWFASWRESVLKTSSDQLNQHEFMGSFLGCIMVISSSEATNEEQLNVLIGRASKLQQQHQLDQPSSWFLPTVLRFYLILHDNSTGDSNSAEALYQLLRTKYTGNVCYMLKINSCNRTDLSGNERLQNMDPWSSFLSAEQILDMSPSTTPTANENVVVDPIGLAHLPHPLSPEEEFNTTVFPSEIGPASQTPTSELCQLTKRGRMLTSDDLQNIQLAINEFIAKALLPYIERHTKVLYESVINRRSMSKSFFGATKRLFTSSSKAVTNVVYGGDSLELTTRKLADLYFLFGNYVGAYQLFHQLKKDFQGDQAWVHHASALEMAALSHFMMTQQDSPSLGARSFPVHYIGESLRVYLENCRAPELAIRCAILSCECLKRLDNYGEAAAVFIRMTAEDCDLRSALMLEQAAYAFLKLNLPRKFALHSVLAGHRYAKAGLRSHSVNSYLQAAQIYYGRGWRFAEDHIFFTIAKHQSFLQHYKGLTLYLNSLLRVPSPQSSPQQWLFLKEFLFMMAKLNEVDGAVHNIFIPEAKSSDIRIRIAKSDLEVGEVNELLLPQTPVSAIWDCLEEEVVKDCIDHSVKRFKPSRLVFDSSTNNSIHPPVPRNEWFYVEIPVHNALSVPLTLLNVRLKFEPGATVTCTTVNELNLEPGKTSLLRFGVISSKRGRIIYEWMLYDLKVDSIVCPFKQKLALKGHRLNSTKTEKLTRVYGKDFRNEINVIEQMPLLHAEFEGLDCSILNSQLKPFNLILHDKSKDPSERFGITKVILAAANMSDFMTVLSESPQFSLAVTKKNYISLNLKFTESITCVKIPCVYHAQQTGDSGDFNLLVVYQVGKAEDHQSLSSTPPSKLEWEPLHRIIMVSTVISLQPCVKAEFLSLKSVDTFGHSGVLKIQNITQMDQVEFSGLELKANVILRSIVSDVKGDISNASNFRLGPGETRNLVIKYDDGDITSDVHVKSQSYLHLDWQLVSRDVSASIPRVTGNYKLRIKKMDIPSLVSDNGEKKFCFQFAHKHQVENNFEYNPFCTCSVDLTFISKWNGKVEIELNNQLDEKLISGEKFPFFPSGDGVTFVGQTKWTLQTKAGMSTTLTYFIILFHPGIYNVAPRINMKMYSESALEEFDEEHYQLHSPLTARALDSFPA